jgi:hypothetical protein
LAEDINVCEGQRWYCLVALVGGYLLVYFLLDCDVTSGSNEGYSVGLGLCRMEFISLKNCTINVPVPDGC